MSLKGIRGTLSSFLSAGGHISVGISKALGATREAIDSYISRHIIGPTLGTVDYIHSIADQGIAAASANNILPVDDYVKIDGIPIVPDQFGDEADGRRITTAIVFGATEDDPGKVIRLDFEDAYSRQDMENVLESLISEWQSESPEAFTEERMPQIRQEGIREIFTTRKF